MKIKQEFNGKEKVYNLDFVYFEDLNYYQISALNKFYEEVGYLTFRITANAKQIWIYKIATQEEYQGKGYGTAMVNTMEFFASTQGIYSVEGKYYPENNKAKPFYDKMGYSIDFDDYSQFISKFINTKQTYQDLAPKISDFEIKTIEKEQQEEISQTR